MRLPVLKILWGMFAFPVMYPGAFLVAAGLPLIAIIAITLVWIAGAVPPGHQAISWTLLITYYGLFAWLAVRCHRMILAREEDGVAASPPIVFRLVFRYLAALVTATVAKNLFVIVAVTVALMIFGRNFVPTPETHPPPAPAMNGDLSWVIDWSMYLAYVPLLYLLARCSTLLPAVALGHEWSPGNAWRQTRDNGWRLVLVVFLLPWSLKAGIDWIYAATENKLLVGVLAVFTSLITALSVIGLSLSYRELPPWPAPPPTTPRD